MYVLPCLNTLISLLFRSSMCSFLHNVEHFLVACYFTYSSYQYFISFISFKLYGLSAWPHVIIFLLTLSFAFNLVLFPFTSYPSIPKGMILCVFQSVFVRVILNSPPLLKQPIFANLKSELIPQAACIVFYSQEQIMKRIICHGLKLLFNFFFRCFTVKCH